MLVQSLGHCDLDNHGTEEDRQLGKAELGARRRCALRDGRRRGIREKQAAGAPTRMGS